MGKCVNLCNYSYRSNYLSDFEVWCSSAVPDFSVSATKSMKIRSSRMLSLLLS